MGISDKLERLKIAFKFGGVPYMIGRAWDFLTRGRRVPADVVLPMQQVNASWCRDIPYNISTYRVLKRQFGHLLDAAPTAQPHAERTHDDKIWWCWLQGEGSAPPICRACLASLRENIPDKEIVVISEKNIGEYAHFPDHIMRKYEQGIITRTHFSDLLRLELLIRHGGTWIDSTILCTERPDEIFDSPFFVYQTSMRADPSVIAQNWLIRSLPENPLLTATRDLLYAYWDRYSILAHYFIFYLCFTIAAERYPAVFEQSPVWSDVPPHIMQAELDRPYTPERWAQLCRISNIHKLTYKMEANRSSETTIRDHLLARWGR